MVHVRTGTGIVKYPIGTESFSLIHLVSDRFTFGLLDSRNTKIQLVTFLKQLLFPSHIH